LLVTQVDVDGPEREHLPEHETEPAREPRQAGQQQRAERIEPDDDQVDRGTAGQSRDDPIQQHRRDRLEPYANRDGQRVVECTHPVEQPIEKARDRTEMTAEWLAQV
jgi:hypothetical protein